MIAKRRINEPGVIPTFKIIITAAWVLLTLGLRRAFQQDPSNYTTLLNWFWTGFLSLYLWIKPIERLFKLWYLPIAILIATLGPMMGMAVSEYLAVLTGLDPTIIVTWIGAVSVWLILPVMVVAIQYSVGVTMGYILTITLLPLFLVIPHWAIPTLRQAHLTQAGARLFILGIAGYIVARMSRDQRKQRDELAETNAKLANYAATLETLTITRERNRLARELHDTLAHTLSAVNVQLQALEVMHESGAPAEDVSVQLVKTRNLTRTGLEDARRALHNLRARPVEELGLSEGIKRTAELAAQRGGFQLQMEVSTHPDQLSIEVQQQIYRIAEEILNNVVRHAQAKQVSLRFHEADQQLLLHIQDDGVGFPHGKDLKGHYGLIGMQERAHLMGAKLAIFSKEGKGTRVEFTLPLSEERV
jgi:signal transduction histidine kinase